MLALKPPGDPDVFSGQLARHRSRQCEWMGQVVIIQTCIGQTAGLLEGGKEDKEDTEDQNQASCSSLPV